MFLLGNACILERIAGPMPTPQVIVVAGGSGTASPETAASPTVGSAPSATPTPEPTARPTATATIAPLTMTAGQALSCVTGPHWILYEWVVAIAKGETVALLAQAPPDWDEYYFVRKRDGRECWAFGGSSMKSGDTSGLPVREAPPLPMITYTIENQTYLPITSVQIRPKDETVWAANRIGGNPIEAQKSFGIAFTAGFYDVRIMDSHGGILYEEQDIPIGGDAHSHHRVINNPIAFTIKNDILLSVCRVSVKHTGSGYTKELPIPDDGRLDPGDTKTFTSLAGIYQIELFRCGALDRVFTLNDAYIGPLTTGFVLLPK
jgi:hypothetical protein